MEPHPARAQTLPFRERERHDGVRKGNGVENETIETEIKQVIE